jgi:hypothetical protein
MKKVECKNCRHFRRAPYDAPRTGCWLPEFMVVKQKDRFLDEQQIPGDHRRINQHGDCPKYEARAARPGLWKRLLAMGT